LPDLFEPMTLARGPAMKSRFALAPLTNLQSHPDGRLSDDEFRWLTYRAKGGFASGAAATRPALRGRSAGRAGDLSAR